VRQGKAKGESSRIPSRQSTVASRESFSSRVEVSSRG